MSTSSPTAHRWCDRDGFQEDANVNHFMVIIEEQTKSRAELEKERVLQEEQLTSERATSDRWSTANRKLETSLVEARQVRMAGRT